MLIYVPLAQIDDNPFQRRQDYGDVEALAADIAARGLLQIPRGRLVYDSGDPAFGDDLDINPEEVLPDGLRVQLAFGHRRLRAFRHLEPIGSDWVAMPVYIEALTDDQMLDAVWSENQHRSDINAIEQAELLAEKLERARAAGGDQTTVAAEWGLARSTIANKIRLLGLPQEVQTAVRERRLSERQALALLPIVEVKEKLNGKAVEWDSGEKPQYYGTPIAPDKFISYAIANPDKVASDHIRDFTHRVTRHVGHALPDYLETFEAGEGEEIVQSTCAGCSHRHNQHCLNQLCFDTKLGRFQETIPLLAAELTGLPWSDDPACFPSERQGAKSLYDADMRLGLVIGWLAEGWNPDRFDGDYSYRSAAQTKQDWREGLILGRLPEYAAAVEEQKPPRLTWQAISYDASTNAKERAKAAFVEACVPLADRYEELRPLLALLDRSLMGDKSPTEFIATLASRRYHELYLHTRDQLEAKLIDAGLDTAVLDPTDPIERLRETAAGALENWYDWRDASHARRAMGAKAIRDAVALFREHNIGPDDDELGDLALWLQRAEADAAAVMAAKTAAQEGV